MESPSMLPGVAVVIITYRRPAFVLAALQHLLRQTYMPRQVLVVDASPDDETRSIAAEFAMVTYIRNAAGAGNMTSSRNAALPHVNPSVEVIAWLDDDANPEPGYVEALARFCSTNPDVDLGCCRALNGAAGEERLGWQSVGQFSPRHGFSGYFAADPGRDVEVAHGLGATMWVRQGLMLELEGFREYYFGTSAREDTDLFLRASRLGRTPWFVTGAVVRHVAAPQHDGERFDIRYTYWTARNSAVLLLTNYGFRSPILWRALGWDVLRNASYGSTLARRAARTVVVALAWFQGVAWTVLRFGHRPLPPRGVFTRQHGFVLQRVE